MRTWTETQERERTRAAVALIFDGLKLLKQLQKGHEFLETIYIHQRSKREDFFVFDKDSHRVGEGWLQLCIVQREEEGLWYGEIRLRAENYMRCCNVAHSLADWNAH